MFSLFPLYSFLILSPPSATIARIGNFPGNQLDGPTQGNIMIWTPLAYLDPGSGSLFLQLLLGGIAGVAVLGKLLWQRIIAAFGIRPGSPDRNAASLQQTDRKEK